MQFEKEFLKIGFKEVLKAISDGTAAKLYIAEDSPEHMKNKLTDAVSGSACEVMYIGSMKDLGECCGIDVKASCAAEIKH